MSLAQRRLEGGGALTLAREAAELPDRDLLEGRFTLQGFTQHLVQLGQA